MKKILFILLLLCTSLFSKTSITIFYPFQKYFIEKIAKNKVFIRTVFDPSTEFNLENKDFVNPLADSQFLFSLNLPEEEAIIKRFKLRNSDLQVFNSSKNIPLIKDKDGKTNPYFWTDPLLARAYAKNIYEKLVDMRVYDKKFFKNNYDLFLKELDEIYLHVNKRIDNSDLYGFFVFDNKLDYFARRYRLATYQKEFRYLTTKEAEGIIKLSHEENVNHIVLETGKFYPIAQSISSLIDGKIVEVNIYDENWKSMLYTLTTNLSNY